MTYRLPKCSDLYRVGYRTVQIVDSSSRRYRAKIGSPEGFHVNASEHQPFYAHSTIKLGDR